MKKKLHQSPKKVSVKPIKGYTKPMKKVHTGHLLKYNTPIADFEKIQGVSLRAPANTTLGNYIKELGFPSLADMLK